MTTASIQNATTTADATVRSGDTAPALVATLKADDGTVVNLTGATVTFSMRDQKTGAILVTGACTLTSATGGVVTYTWVTGNTDVAGVYNADFKVTFSGGAIETFPNSRFLIVSVQPAL